MFSLRKLKLTILNFKIDFLYITLKAVDFAQVVDSSKMLPHFLRAMYRCRSLPCPAGEARDGRPRRRECVEEASDSPAESGDLRGNQLRL